MSDDLDKLIEEALGLGASEDGPGQRMMFYHDDLRAVAEKAYKLGYNIGGHEVDGDLLVAEGKGRRELARELLAHQRSFSEELEELVDRFIGRPVEYDQRTLKAVRDALRELQGYCEEGGWMPMLKKYEGKTEDSDILPTYSVFDLFGKGGKFEVAEEK